MMAAFFISGCQRKEESFFEVSGGDPIMLQHFFWFIGHPEIFIPLLFIAGALAILILRRISKRFATFINRPLIFKFTLPWLWLYAGAGFIALGFAIGFIGPWLISGESFGTQNHLHDSYYIVAHIHYILALSFGFLLFASLYWVLGKVLKYRYNRTLALLQLVLFIMGVFLMLVPQFAFMTEGMPRRYIENPTSFEIWNKITGIGAFLCLMSTAAFILVVIEALVKKRLIGDRGGQNNYKPNER